jgi:hypothetical protein
MKGASEERPLCQRAERSNAVICAGRRCNAKRHLRVAFLFYTVII